MDIKQIYPVVSQAIRENNLEKVVEVVSSDKEILNMMTPFGTWLQFAAGHGRLDIVKKLVELGLDVNKQGGTFNGNALNDAASEGDVEVVKYLLLKGAEIDVSELMKNPLFAAIYNGHIDIAKLLIENGLDYTVNYSAQSRKKHDALNYARTFGRTEIVNYLASLPGISTEANEVKSNNTDIGQVSFKDYKDALKTAVIQHYNVLKENNPTEIFYGYSLYTSDDAESISPVANKISDVSLDKFDPMYGVYKYCPDEWSEWDDFGLFEKTNHMIAKLYDEMKDEFIEYKRCVLNTALDALAELDSEGVFGEKNNERFLVVWVSDSSNKIKRISAEKLNTSEVYKEFAALL